MSETILEKTEGRVSYHDSVEEMLKRIREDGMSNVFDRWELQEKSDVNFVFKIKLSTLFSRSCRISEKEDRIKGMWHWSRCNGHAKSTPSKYNGGRDI